MAHDERGSDWGHGAGSAQNVFDHWLASDRMQHLGQGGLHAGSLARRKDDDMDVTHQLFWSYDRFLGSLDDGIYVFGRPSELPRHGGHGRPPARQVFIGYLTKFSHDL